jgi:hypothetical protein
LDLLKRLGSIYEGSWNVLVAFPDSKLILPEVALVLDEVQVLLIPVNAWIRRSPKDYSRFPDEVRKVR